MTAANGGKRMQAQTHNPKIGYNQVMHSPPTLVDLFCGAGGISHGFEGAGFRVLGGVDFNADSIATFSRNHTGARGICSDLSQVSGKQLAEELDLKPGSVDCVAGGPPCQGFSRNRAFRHKDGKFVDDPRNHLYWHFFEFVEYLRPKTVVMENVPEILIKANGFFREVVFERFRSMGYAVNAEVLNAAEYGVPQRRKRAIFLAGCDGMKISFPRPTHRLGAKPGRRTPSSKGLLKPTTAPTEPLALFKLAPQGPSIWDAIGDLHGEYAETLDGSSRYAGESETEYQRDRRGSMCEVENHYPWPLSERQLRRIRLLREGEGQAHLPEKLQVKGGYGSAYRRMQADAQALTLTTWMFHPGSGMFTHPKDDRVVTIREAARLQSFQDEFVFTGHYHSQCRQVGNAVAPLVAMNLAQAVCNAIGGTSEGSVAARMQEWNLGVAG